MPTEKRLRHIPIAQYDGAKRTGEGHFTPYYNAGHIIGACRSVHKTGTAIILSTLGVGRGGECFLFFVFRGGGAWRGYV